MQALITPSYATYEAPYRSYSICCCRKARCGKKWSKMVASTLCVSGIASVFFTVIAYLSSDWSLFGRNIYYTAVFLQGAGCLAMNIPKKSLEDDINDLKNTNDELRQCVQNIENQSKLQVTDILNLRNSLQLAALQINRSQGELTSKERNIEKISRDLEATATTLFAMEKLHSKYQNTTDQVQQEIKYMADDNSLILGQIKRIESINRAMRQIDGDEKKTILDIKFLNDKVIDQENQSSEALCEIDKSLQLVVHSLKKDADEQDGLGKKLSILTQGNEELSEMVHELGRNVHDAESTEQRMAELIAKLAEVQKLEQGHSV